MLTIDPRTDAMSARRIEEIRGKWNAPPRHAQKKIVPSGPWGEAFAKVRAKLGKGCFIALIGTRGNGKTQMGVELMKLASSELRTAMYETAYGFFLRVRECYKGEAERTERQVLAEFRKPSLLVMDEIAKRSDREWENRLLFHLFDCRYMDGKDIIVIANQTEPEFMKMMDPSLASRMKETGGIITFDWETFR